MYFQQMRYQVDTHGTVNLPEIATMVSYMPMQKVDAFYLILSCSLVVCEALNMQWSMSSLTWFHYVSIVLLTFHSTPYQSRELLKNLLDCSW